MGHRVQELVGFIAAHAIWAGPIMFLVCFGESLAFLSLVFPGTSILLATGALIPSGAVPFWPVLIFSMLGATLGDSISYYVGRRFGHSVEHVWPFARNPHLLLRGIKFFERHGDKSVFIGRFFGPIRAVIPLAAGLMKMPAKAFWIANVTSATVWVPAVLVPGLLVGFAAKSAAAANSCIAFALVVLVVAGGIGLGLAKRCLRRRQ